MEEDAYTTKKKVNCNHGLVVRLKTSWTSNNHGRRYWSCPYYGVNIIFVYFLLAD